MRPGLLLCRAHGEKEMQKSCQLSERAPREDQSFGSLESNRTNFYRGRQFGLKEDFQQEVMFKLKVEEE